MDRGSGQNFSLCSGGANMLGSEGSTQKYIFVKRNSRHGAELGSCPTLIYFPSLPKGALPEFSSQHLIRS